MDNLIPTFFSSDNFMPHGHCYLWRSDILWLNVVSDILIALAYYAIPFLLIYIVRKRKDLAFNWIFVMFAMFIVACGTTHLIEVLTTWHPFYGAQGLVKFFTAAISIATGIALWRLLPKILTLPGAEDLEQKNKELQALNDQLRNSSESRLHQVIEAAANGLLMVDQSGKIVLCNAQIELLFGYNRKELIGAKIEILVPERFRQKHPDHRTGYFKNPETRQMGAGRDLSGLRKDGTEFPVEIGLNPVRTDEGQFVLASIIDITDRKRAEEKLNQVIEAAPNGLLMVDQSGKIVLCNAQIESLFGYAREELRGQKIEILVPERFRPKHPNHRTDYFIKPETRQMGAGRDLSGLRKDGKEFSVEIGLNPVRTYEGQFVLASIIDITERKEVERKLREAKGSEERFKLFIDSVKDYAIFMLDANGNIISWNPSAERMKGYSAEEVFGKHFSIFYPQKDILAGRPRLDLNLAVSEGKFEEEQWRVRKDGTTFWASVVITPLKDENGNLIGFGKVVRDLTERKQSEEAIHNAIVSKKESAEAANLAKSAFLANMSHEIRTPLGAMMGFADLIIDPQVRPSEKANFVTAIKRNGELLSNIINDILDLSKIEAGKMQIDAHEVALTEILTDTKTLLDLQARDKGIALNILLDENLPEIIRTDALRLRQILINIIGNAVKFTSKGGVDVRIMRVPSKNGNDFLTFVVKDTGRGISEDQAEKLFAPFSQADATSKRKYGGTGLGLVLSKRFANLLGGDVVLTQSTPDKGSTFTITIDPGPIQLTPTEATVETTPKPFHGEQPRLDGIKVLLADDSFDNQLVISRFLKLAGATVEVASNGKEAVEKAKKDQYHVLLMDLQMPVMDGFEATAELRKDGYRGKIVALTAHTLSDDRERCLQNGFDEHIGKPVNRNALIEIVDHLSKHGKTT